jgi:hypothetical protein
MRMIVDPILQLMSVVYTGIFLAYGHTHNCAARTRETGGACEADELAAGKQYSGG